MLKTKSLIKAGSAHSMSRVEANSEFGSSVRSVRNTPDTNMPLSNIFGAKPETSLPLGCKGEPPFGAPNIEGMKPVETDATEGLDVQQALEKRVSTSADPLEPVRQDNTTGARPKIRRNTPLNRLNKEQLETPNIQPKPGQGLTNYTDDFSQLLAEVIAERESSNNDYANSNVPESWFSVDKNDLDTYTKEVNKRLGEFRDNDLSIHLANSLSQRDYSTITWQDRVHLLEKAAERNKPDDKTTPEKRKWYEETKKEAEILKEAGKNVGEDGNISISYAHIDAPGNPGKARVYMAIFERSDDGSYKDVQQNDKGELKKLGDKPMWIGIGAPHRALSYLHKYRLSGAARPVIRSFLVDKSFLEEHLPRIETERSRKDPDGTRLMNVDTKEYNQFEMKVSTKEKKEFKETKINEKTGEEIIITKKKDVMVDSSLFDSLLKNAVPGSLQTIAYPDYRDSHSESEGTLISVDDFERDLGYKSGVSVSSRDDVFGKIAKKDNDWVFPSSEGYVDKVTEMRSTFDILEKLGTSEVTELLSDEGIREMLKNNLGDLLEANKMTPAAVLGENFETSELKKKVLENSRTEKDFLTTVLNSSSWHKTAQEIASKIGKFIEEDAHKVKNECLELEEKLRREKNKAKRNKIEKSLQSVSSRSATNILLRNHYIQSDLSRLGFPPTEEGLTAALKALAEGKLKDKPRELLKILFHTFRPLATQVEHKEGKALPFPHAIDGVDDTDKVKVNNRHAVKDPYLLLNSSHRTKTSDDIFQSDRNYVPDMSNPMTTYMRDRSIPFVGGISGTTRDISSRLEEIIGDLSADDYWTLQIMNAAFMIDNGYHSFFEAMYSAARYDTKSPVGEQIVKKIDEMKTGATIDTPSVYGSILNLIPGIKKLAPSW